MIRIVPLTVFVFAGFASAQSTTLVSVDSGGVPSDSFNAAPALSSDGRGFFFSFEFRYLQTSRGAGARLIA